MNERKIKRTVSHDRITLTAEFANAAVTIRWNRYSHSVSGKGVVSRDTLKRIAERAANFETDETVGTRAERFERAAREHEFPADFAAAL